MKKLVMFVLMSTIIVMGLFAQKAYPVPAQKAYVITSDNGANMVPVYPTMDIWAGTCTIKESVSIPGATNGKCIVVSTDGSKGWWGLGRRAAETGGKKHADLSGFKYLVVRMMYPADAPYSSNVLIGFQGREARGQTKMEKDADGGRQQIRKKVRMSSVNDGQWHTYVIDLSKYKRKLSTSFVPFIMLFATNTGRGSIAIDQVYYDTVLPAGPYEILK